VNYIRELENYIRELEECIEKKINYTSPLPMECTQLFSPPRNSTLHYYPVPSTCMEQESGPTLDCYIVPSTPMAEYSGGPSTPMVTGPSSPMAEVTGPSSPMAELTVVSTPMDDHSTDAITVPVEITELTSSDEIAQWVGVNLNSDEEEEELPEFNSVEELMAWYIDA
jgi:hypothetical protein